MKTNSNIEPFSGGASSIINSLFFQLAFGVTSILCLTLITALINNHFLKLSATQFSQYSQLRKQADALSQVNLTISQMNRAVDLHATRGFDSSKARALTLLDELSQTLQKTENKETDSYRRELLVRMRKELISYRKNFSLMAKDRKIVTNFLEIRLPTALENLNRSIEDTSSTSTSEKNARKQINIALAKAQNLLLLYFLRFETRHLDKGLRELKTIKNVLRRSSGNKNVLKRIDQLTSVTIRATQATSSYLYFVRVLLAAQTYELIRTSNELRTNALKQSGMILSNSLQRSQILLGTSWFMNGAAIVVGLIIAVILGIRIPKPIRNITETFRLLSKGEKIEQIPGIERDDEIGALAKAAESFKAKNEQTEQLFLQAAQLTRDLQSQKEALAFTNQQLDSFAYIASHDLRAPLRGIERLTTWVVEDSRDTLSSDSVEHLDKIQQRILKMKTLLQDLLDYSRAGRTDLKTERTDTNSLLEDIIRLVDPPTQHSIELRGIYPTIETSRIALEQVFLNLITNSIKYNDKEQGVTIVECEDLGDHLRFQIRDNGAGIEARFHEKVFEMYQRCTDDRSVDGTGMGLAIVKKQIEIRGGKISLTSEKGHGSNFSFSWPKREHVKSSI